MIESRPKLGGPLGPHADREGGPPRGLAARLVNERLRRGLSQERAAEEIGANRVTIAGWETGTEPRGLYRRIVDLWLRGEWPPRR